jgi:hypothetical protein
MSMIWNKGLHSSRISDVYTRRNDPSLHHRMPNIVRLKTEQEQAGTLVVPTDILS